jgi:hypothetical protein
MDRIRQSVHDLQTRQAKQIPAAGIRMSRTREKRELTWDFKHLRFLFGPVRHADVNLLLRRREDVLDRVRKQLRSVQWYGVDQCQRLWNQRKENFNVDSA